MSKDELKVILVYPTPEGSREVALENGELRVGRGDVALRFADNGLSRHHATIFRDGERIWILDENSTNGTFVNGSQVAPSGTILNNGDSIRFGDNVIVTLKFQRRGDAATQRRGDVNQNITASPRPAVSASHSIIPLAVAAIALFVIGAAIVAVVAKTIIFADPEPVIAQSNQSDTPVEEDEDEPENTNKKTKTDPSPTTGNTNSTTTNTNSVEQPKNTPPPLPVAPTKTYLQMSDTEKRAYIEKQSEIVSRMLGNTSSDVIPPEAVERIKSFVDSYARRLNRPKLTGACNFTRDNLETLIERASQNARFIVPSFNAESIAPQIGIYLAMIESEHCVCLQSPTKPLGMFQFTKDTGERFGLVVKSGASPQNPDERCIPEKAAPAAARYMKFLTARYGTGASSLPLAIASYNSGEGGLSRNLETSLKSAADQERNFWSLLIVADKLSVQFQKENKNYVPKFFASAIVGENPTVFGVNKPPISSNTR